jgi:hypothetical protein
VPTAHPLLRVFLAAAGGDFPPVDGQAVLLPALEDGLQAVVSLTGRAHLACSAEASGLGDLRLDGFGAALQPSVLQRLAGVHGRVGMIDATLVARGLGGGQLPSRYDLEGHPRVQHARTLRRDVRVHGDDRGLITLARGLAGRTELSVEVDGERAGVGRELIRDALALVPHDDPVFAAVSPGNARSLRAFLAVGFQPVGSEVIITPR